METPHYPEDSLPRGPIVIATLIPGSHWRYLWWDSADSYVLGEQPTRRKLVTHVNQVLSALLADCARTTSSSPFEGPEAGPVDAPSV